MSWTHLLWVVPISMTVGALITAVLIGGVDDDN